MGDVTVAVKDGGLGVLPFGGGAQPIVSMGVCSAGVPNQFYGFGDIGAAQAALGQGPLVEALAVKFAIAGGPQYCMPVTPSQAGTAGAVTHTGTGGGTVAATLGPVQQQLAKIVTGGALGTMQFQVALGGGAYGPTISTVGGGPFTYRVPGTQTDLTFAAQTYTLNDVWTVPTTGVITVAGAGTAGWVTQASSPGDAYNVLLTIKTPGAPGTAAFTYSLDGGGNTSPTIAVPGSGVYAIPGTGVVLTFAGTFVAADTYALTTAAAGFTNTDVTSTFTALLASPAAQAIDWRMAHVVGTPASASAAASTATVVQAQMGTAFAGMRFGRCFTECPTSESDNTVITAFANFVGDRVAVGAGDFACASPITGRVTRRNWAWIASALASAVRPGVDIGWVQMNQQNVKTVQSLFRDDAAAGDTFDAARFITPRTRQGMQGYFTANGRTMAASGSDFMFLTNARVMDLTCSVARGVLLPYINASTRVSKTTGYIDERDAQKIEGKANALIGQSVVNTGDATDAQVQINRSTAILSTQTMPTVVSVTPLGYSRAIPLTVGFSNPALGT
jgi:hypothetical protein